jgi:acetyltransferase-like isoleucine patch superfamily enzyme
MLIRKNKIPVFEIIFVGFLPSFIKKIYYRLKGYKIGKNVSIGLGSVIIGKQVRIEDNSKIGYISVIRARKIDIRRFAVIGSITMLDTESIFIDEDARINENVIVGGQKTPESFFKLGKRAIIMEYSFINPTKPIEIGDDSGIGGHCLLFTHGSWLNQLDGFPVTFAKITIGERVWLPWRVFIMPGVNIGNDVVIGANSLISSDLPSNVLAAGSPAKIIKTNYPNQISEEKREEVIEKILTEFVAYIKYNNYIVEECETNKGRVITFKMGRRTHCMCYLKSNSTDLSLTEKFDLLLTDKTNNNQTNCKMTLNLRNKTRIGKSDIGEEVARYLSRHGIRFNRLD